MRALSGNVVDGLLNLAVQSPAQTKATLLSSAIAGITGIAPTLTRDSAGIVTLHFLPQHGEFLDALVFQGAAKANPNDPLSGIDLDYGPAASVIVWRRIAPITMGLFFAGYLSGMLFPLLRRRS